MIEVETTDRSGIFRSQAKLTMMETKGIEFLPQFLPKAGSEEIAALKSGRINLSIACMCQECTELIYHPTLMLMRFWQEIVHTAQSLNALLHKYSLLLVKGQTHRDQPNKADVYTRACGYRTSHVTTSLCRRLSTRRGLPLRVLVTHMLMLKFTVLGTIPIAANLRVRCVAWLPATTRVVTG